MLIIACQDPFSYPGLAATYLIRSASHISLSGSPQALSSSLIAASLNCPFMSEDAFTKENRTGDFQIPALSGRPSKKWGN